MSAQISRNTWASSPSSTGESSAWSKEIPVHPVKSLLDFPVQAKESPSMLPLPAVLNPVLLVKVTVVAPAVTAPSRVVDLILFEGAVLP
jgi:hypothetical protein